MTPKTKSLQSSWVIRAAAITFARLILNTARRFAYPFAPALARGLGTSIPAITYILALSQFVSFLGVLAGPISDRFGHRRLMLAGLLLLVVGMAACMLKPSYSTLLAALLLAGIGKTLFDPAVQAYIGERIALKRRAAVIGLLESCWAGSMLVGTPLLGLAMAHYGWQAAIFLLGAGGLLAFVLLFRVLTEYRRQPTQSSIFSAAWRHMLTNRASLGLLLFGFFFSAVSDNFLVIFGLWFEGDFHMSVAGLGMTTMLLGGAELVGELGTASFADRMGLVKAIGTGAGLVLAGFVLLPWAGTALVPALVVIFLIFMGFEFAIVSCFAVCTELLPDHRATMMAGFYGAAGLGRVAGALSGAALWSVGGLAMVCMASAIGTLAALAALAAGMHRHPIGKRF